MDDEKLSMIRQIREDDKGLLIKSIKLDAALREAAKEWYNKGENGQQLSDMRRAIINVIDFEKKNAKQLDEP